MFIRNLLITVKFNWIVFCRFLNIIFRDNKQLQLFKLEFDNDIVFKKSYVVLNYRFKNALYYKFGNIQTIEKERIVFDVNNIKDVINLTVYGFFQSKTYFLEFNPKLEIKNKSFITEITDFETTLNFKNFNCRIVETKIYATLIVSNIKNFNVVKNKLSFKPIPFNQSEFI
jgi:hypothetical protein